MTDLSDKVALVYDLGLFPFVATKLAEKFGKVLYHTPYASDISRVSRKTLWGSGLPGVERANDFFDAVKESDVIVFPDVGLGDLQTFLRESGKAVWGSGAAEVLELDRVGFKRLLNAKKMPSSRTWLLEGVEELGEHLQDAENENQYIKIGGFRGDFETFHHKNWWLSEPWYKRQVHQLGPLGPKITFVAEEAIDDATEIGYDGYVVNGDFAPLAAFGYEDKDKAYIGQARRDNKLPTVLRETNMDLESTLRSLSCTSMFSTEVRVVQGGTGYLIDPTMRSGSPPSECLLEMFANWPEVIYAGANGEMVELEPLHQYGAQLILRGSWAEDGFLPVRFPDEYRRFVKLHGHAIVDGTDYVVSIGMDVIGAAVGVGASVEEAKAKAIEVAEAIEGDGVEFDVSGFDTIEQRIMEGQERGINW